MRNSLRYSRYSSLSRPSTESILAYYSSTCELDIETLHFHLGGGRLKRCFKVSQIWSISNFLRHPIHSSCQLHYFSVSLVEILTNINSANFPDFFLSCCHYLTMLAFVSLKCFIYNQQQLQVTFPPIIANTAVHLIWVSSHLVIFSLERLAFQAYSMFYLWSICSRFSNCKQAALWYHHIKIINTSW